MWKFKRTGGANLAGSEGVRVESWQYEVLAGEVGHGDVLEVGVVHPRLARDEPGPIGSSRLNIYEYISLTAQRGWGLSRTWFDSSPGPTNWRVLTTKP